MVSPKSPKDKFLVNVINPYLAEVMKHPQTLWVEEGVLHKEDLKGPAKEGSTRARLEEVDQEVFNYKLMIERGVEANCDIIAELKRLICRKYDPAEWRLKNPIWRENLCHGSISLRIT
ncbi:40S ribosomal protein S5-1 [Hordeum vulgare]|nr:40S ribosomal protein S5-1 [Hordeum vulgare]